MSNGFLIDTNILSRLSPDRKKQPSGGVRAWFHEQGEAGTLYLSAMTIAEIERGMRQLHRSGGVERARRLNAWLDGVTDSFGERILGMDSIVARIAGAMDDMARSKGHSPGLADIIIAATAQAYDLTVVTENLKHFLPLGIRAEFPAIFGPDG